MKCGHVKKRQTASLESVPLGVAKKIIGCSSNTCNEVVRGKMRLDSLKCRRDRCKLKWWYKVNNMESLYSLYLNASSTLKSYNLQLIFHCLDLTAATIH